jgi:general secretion pathway protein D
MNKLFRLDSLVRVIPLVTVWLLWGGVPSARAQVINAATTPTTVYPIEDQIELGPVLDVLPVVLSDGYTINLTLIPTLTEFTGYLTPPTQPALPAGTAAIFVPAILPDFTARQVVTTVNVWGGQTVVLGGLISETVTKEKDKVPILGDIPLLGRLFQSESKTSQKKNLMIFVTPTIIDQAGNRMHAEDEMPFAQSSIPAQPLGATNAPVSLKKSAAPRP